MSYDCTCNTLNSVPCRGCMVWMGDLEYEVIELRNGEYALQIKRSEYDQEDGDIGNKET